MTTINSAGYYNTSRGLLHRVIWEKNYGKIPKGLEINHKDGNKLNNELSNLELVTHQENAIPSRRVLGNKGGCLKGEEHPKAKLTWEKVRWIRQHIKEYTLKELAEKFGVSIYTIADVKHNRSWKEGANHSRGSSDKDGVQ